MAVHKVPQDVEADDKLIGFLSMKQFIFVIVAAMLSFVAFQLAKVNAFLVVPFIPFIAAFGVLGLYQRKDQSVEVYLLAALGFYLKPHRRIWNQDGVLETVNITVPKKIKENYSDGLSKVQVKSRLNRLSTLMDTRGWATKNAEFQTNVVVPTTNGSSDRLISPAAVAVAQPSDIHASDDIMDVSNNPTARNFDSMMQQVTQQTHDEALAQMRQQPADSSVQAPNYNPAPSGIHQKIISPMSKQSYQQNDTPIPASTASIPQENSTASTMTPPTSDAILELANRRDDNLSVETIAKEAERIRSLDSDETISLH